MSRFFRRLLFVFGTDHSGHDITDWNAAFERRLETHNEHIRQLQKEVEALKQGRG